MLSDQMTLTKKVHWCFCAKSLMIIRSHLSLIKVAWSEAAIKRLNQEERFKFKMFYSVYLLARHQISQWMWDLPASARSVSTLG